MKNFNEFNKGLPITETILLGRSVQMGDRRGRIVKVVSVGETSRWDTIYKVKFQDGTQVEMHDAQIRPFLIEKSGAGEEATDELDDTYRKDTPGEEEEVEEAFGLDTIKAFIEDVAKKLKMDKFSRSERARLTWGNFSAISFTPFSKPEVETEIWREPILKLSSAVSSSMLLNTSLVLCKGSPIPI